MTYSYENDGGMWPAPPSSSRLVDRITSRVREFLSDILPIPQPPLAGYQAPTEFDGRTVGRVVGPGNLPLVTHSGDHDLEIYAISLLFADDTYFQLLRDGAPLTPVYLATGGTPFFDNGGTLLGAAGKHLQLLLQNPVAVDFTVNWRRHRR